MLSQRAKQLKSSPTLALVAKEKELKAQGHDVISLAVGEPDWNTAENIKNRGIKAIQDNFTKYTPVSGVADLRKAILNSPTETLGLKYDLDQVIVGAGAKGIIFTAIEVLCDPGDEVIIPAPYWVSYPEMVEFVGAKTTLVRCKKENQFKMTPQELEEAITYRTKLLIFNSPSNPTGEVYTKEELIGLANVLKRHQQVVILCDDIYNRLVFGEDGLAPHMLQIAPELKERTILVNGASKTYAMTGWRMGWAIGPHVIVKAMSNCLSQTVGSTCSISQMAALEAVVNGDQAVASAVENLKKRRSFALDKLSTVKNIKPNNPQGAFYIWLDLQDIIGKKHKERVIKDCKTFCSTLLEEELVALVPGEDFGYCGYARMSYVISPQRLEDAIERMAHFVNSLK